MATSAGAIAQLSAPDNDFFVPSSSHFKDLEPFRIDQSSPVAQGLLLETTRAPWLGNAVGWSYPRRGLASEEDPVKISEGPP